MGDQLTKISRKDLPQLRDKYKDRDVKNYLTFVTIDTYIRWFQQDPDVKHIQFYCVNDDLSHGTFVVTDRDIAYADTLNQSSEELLRLLLLLDFSKGFFFLGVNERCVTQIREAIRQKKAQISCDNPAIFYILPKERASQLHVQPPDGIKLKRLTEPSDIEHIHSAWPFKWGTSYHYLLRQAKFNPCIGAFNNDGTPISWVFRSSNGLICALQTDQNHYGHGYGSLVTKAISKQIAESGYDPYAAVYDWNTASRRLFEQIGYQAVGTVYYLYIKNQWSDAEE